MGWLVMSIKVDINKRLEKSRPTRVFNYNHAEGRIGVMVELESDTDFALRNDLVKDFAHELCLQICSMNPDFLSFDKIPMKTSLDIINSIEQEVSLQHQSKPDNIKAKIYDGKFKSWKKEYCLLDQHCVKDGTAMIGEMLSELCEKLGETVEILRFARFGKIRVDND